LAVSGWARGTVESVSGIQGVAWSARNRGVRLQHFILLIHVLVTWILCLLLPNTIGQRMERDATVQADQRVRKVLD
jgi:hypothetical protein